MLNTAMAKSTTNVKQKKMGRPVAIGAAGAGEFVGLRLPADLLKRVDRWGASEKADGRSDAIRQLLELGLKK